MIDLLQAYHEVLDHHRRWYDSFEKYDHLARWEVLLVEQPEAAICEAMVREELERYVDVVYPFEDLGKGGPDFQCFQKTPTGQSHFYVDACCMTIDALTNASGLPYRTPPGASSFAYITDKFKAEAQRKARQLSGLDAPGLVALATLHLEASAHCFTPHAAKQVLTSETLITQRLNTSTGEPIGDIYLSTDMRKAAFQRIDPASANGLADMRQSISGLLFCPFGYAGPYKLHGVLHPNPVRPFDVAMLPRIPFAVLELDPEGQGVGVSYRWHGPD
jgi:hypothetical protein